MSKHPLDMYLVVILVFISGLSVTAQPMNASGSNMTNANASTCLTVCITSVQTIPTHPVVGGIIELYANVTNNKQESIFFIAGPTLPGISATFDNHVTTVPQHVMCPMYLMKDKINRGETVTLSATPCGMEYKVVSPGTVTGIATFPYNGGVTEKPFLFNVG